MTKRCPNCNKRRALVHKTYGVTFCKTCQLNEDFDKPRQGTEFTTDRIRDDRREYGRDILQPYHGETLSKEYLQEYGTTGIEATKEQIKNAKYTNKGQKGWWNRKKGKGGGKGRKTAVGA